jgi:NTE family protein
MDVNHQEEKMAKKTALVLSGGGAKGAFQVGAEQYAREVRGYHWDVIAGVSVGALNGVMLGMEKYQELLDTWNTIANDKVYSGGFNLFSVIKLLLGAKSFYGNQPLQQLLKMQLEPDRIKADLRMGAVSLFNGEYTQFNKESPNLAAGILASTVIPVIWEPVEVSPEYRSMVDGGVRNISPIGDVLDTDPDEIVIINCSPIAADPLKSDLGDVVKIGLRALDIAMNELFVSDMREFERINYLVQQAAAQGFTLYNPSGRPYRYFPCHIIEPDLPLNDTLDFSQASVQRSFQAGLAKARQVLG